MISDSKQQLWLSFVCCSRLTRGESGSTKALTNINRRNAAQVLAMIKGFLQILRISTEDVLYSAMFVSSHEQTGGTLIWDSQSKKLTKFSLSPFISVTRIAHMQRFTVFLLWNDCEENKYTNSSFINITTESTVHLPPPTLPIASLFHLCPRCLLFCSLLLGSPTVFL